eukprot:1965238-Alexandrium_andersonii.AAC.1
MKPPREGPKLREGSPPETTLPPWAGSWSRSPTPSACSAGRSGAAERTPASASGRCLNSSRSVRCLA